MDTIFLHGLKVDCVIGVWEWERRIIQTIIFDTLSYRDVAKRVTAHVQAAKANLIERLAEEVAGIILEEFGAKWCRVRVNKRGAVTHAGDVGVLIERGSTD